MKNRIHPSIWFDQNASEASIFYAGIFDDFKLIGEGPVSVTFEIEGMRFLGINGGPMFQPNPSISFYIECDSEAEIDAKYERLLQGGKVLMPLQKYDWTPMYAFIQDRFGVAWQLNLRLEPNDRPKITPTLLFVNEKNGKAADAIDLYTSIFPEGRNMVSSRYGVNQGNTEGYILFSDSVINGFPFIAMDGPGTHDFDFSEGVSFVVYTEDQDETDYLWDSLTANGGVESQCGWLKDPFGVSWQIVPDRFMELVGMGPDAFKRVMDVVMPMKRIIIADLENAAGL